MPVCCAGAFATFAADFFGEEFREENIILGLTETISRAKHTIYLA